MPFDIGNFTATEIVDHIRKKDFSVTEVMEAHLAQIEKINPKVNAIVTFIPEQALFQAKRVDEEIAQGRDLGILEGLPVAHKDMALTKEIRTTFGSPIFRDFFPERDSLIVERLKKAGAITVGKTNTPEFGTGSQTFNEIFGKTLNPYDLTKTCGGSSGGAAVALACDMVPIADGSDTGGSLRNPASFCNVVGFRSSPGRVPIYPTQTAWSTLPIHGPMAKTVSDIALVMSAIAGPDFRSPIANPEPGSIFQTSLEQDFKGIHIAWNPDCGDLIPVEPSVVKVLELQRHVFEDLGCNLEEEIPYFSGAGDIFSTERAWLYELNYGKLLKEYREELKDTVIEEIERGIGLSGSDLGRIEIKKTDLFQRMTQFMQKFNYLILPVTQVLPFDVNKPYVDEIDGTPLEKYTDWMKSCWTISITGLPAISVPCGFSEEGLPVGIQIVGRHQDDLGVLKLAYAFEQATQFWKRKPILEV